MPAKARFEDQQNWKGPLDRSKPLKAILESNQGYDVSVSAPLKPVLLQELVFGEDSELVLASSASELVFEASQSPSENRFEAGEAYHSGCDLLCHEVCLPSTRAFACSHSC